MKAFVFAWMLALSAGFLIGCRTEKPISKTEPSQTPTVTSPSEAEPHRERTSLQGDPTQATGGSNATTTEASQTLQNDVPAPGHPEGMQRSELVEARKHEAAVATFRMGLSMRCNDSSEAGSKDFLLPEMDGLKDGPKTFRRYGVSLAEGPLVVDFSFHVQGASLEKTNERVREWIFHELVGDEVDSIAWEEVLKLPSIENSAYGNLQATEEDQKKSIVKMYDKDRDDRANARELHAFLTRGLSERSSVVLEEANRSRGENADRSPLFMRLDVNKDGVLDDEEIERAPSVLRVFDSNADYVVTLAESRAVEADPNAARRQRNRAIANLFTNLLSPDYSPNSKGINEVFAAYRSGLGLVESSWPKRVPLFHLLDVDRDGSLSRSELLGLAKAPSDVTFEVGFEECFPAMGLKADPSSVLERSVKKGAGPPMNRDGLRWNCRLNDHLDSASLARRIELNAQALGVSRDKGVAIVQQPGNPGIINPRGLDRNGDEKLEWEELESGIQRKAALTSGLVRVRLVDVPDGWFTWLDLDWDNVLSENEINQSSTRLIRLKTDRDSVIAPESLPVQLEVIISRPFGDEDPFLSVSQEPESGESLKRSSTSPEWLSAMDTNGDGLVVFREFLGTADAFRRLDRDGNGGLDSQDFLEK